MHTEGQVIKFLESIFHDVKISERGKNANVSCPFCKSSNRDKKKLAIRTDNWITHCWVCGFKSKNLIPVLRVVNPSLIKDYVEFAADTLLVAEKDNEKIEETVTLPRGFIMLATLIDKDASLSARRAIAYLRKRGISDEDMWYYKFGITNEDAEYSNRVIIPSHDSEGELNFFVGRSFSNDRERYRNPAFKRQTIVFNELNIDWTKELTLVEGPFDLVKVNQNATCLLGKELRTEDLLFQKIIANNTPIVLSLDSDAQKFSRNIAHLLLSYEIPTRQVHLPKGCKDPGEMNHTDFLELLKSATVVSELELLREKIYSLGNH